MRERDVAVIRGPARIPAGGYGDPRAVGGVEDGQRFWPRGNQPPTGPRPLERVPLAFTEARDSAAVDDVEDGGEAAVPALPHGRRNEPAAIAEVQEPPTAARRVEEEHPERAGRYSVVRREQPNWGRQGQHCPTRRRRRWPGSRAGRCRRRAGA